MDGRDWKNTLGRDLPPNRHPTAPECVACTLDRYIVQIYPSPRVKPKPLPAARRAPRENRTRYVILGMLTAAPQTGYGLRKAIAGSVGHFWQESFGQLYPALRRLVAEGLVEARATQGGPGRGGATYHVTPAGRAALAAWLAVPPALAPQRNEVLLKVFFAGAVPPEVSCRNLDRVATALRGELAALEEIARVMDAPGGGAHPDAPHWRLTLDFGLGFLRFALAWIARAQGVIARQARPRAPRLARRTR
jgi:PadR family transcriptional regulator AphA